MATPPPRAAMTKVRADPYRAAHKALRVVLARLLENAGRIDFGDRASIGPFRAELEAAVHQLSMHARMEVQFVDPLLGSYDPACASAIQHDHVELERQLHHAAKALHEAEQILSDRADPGDRDRADARERGHAFYLALSRVVASYLTHFADEEERVLPLLHRHVPQETLDAALAEARRRLAPIDVAHTAGLMLRAISHPERVALMNEEPSAGLYAVARLTLTDAEWTALEEDADPGDLAAGAPPDEEPGRGS